MKIEQHRLANGLRLLLNEDHSAPLVAINLWYHVGSKNEKAGRTGFAHLFEHMLFSGSEHVGNNEHFRYVQSVGGILNGSTFFDRTNYYETLPSNYLELGLWLESDRLGFFLPALTREKLDIQREVVKEERRQRYDNVPYGTALEHLYALAYPPDHSYHWPTIGSMEDLEAASLDDISEFFRAWYAPNNAVLSLAGDFDPVEALALVEKYFGPIPSAPAFSRVSPGTPSPAGERRETVYATVQLPRTYWLYHLPGMGEPDWIAADLLAGILAGDKSSRFEQRLVYKEQIAQEVVSFVFPTESTSMFLLYATPKEGVTLEALEAALERELALAAADISEVELSRAMNRMEHDYAHQLQTCESRAELLGMFATYFDDPGLLTSWPERYRAVTPAGLRELISRRFVPANRAVVQFLPSTASPEGEVQS